MLCQQVMDFHFLVMEKSWKINVEKEGAPCTLPGATLTLLVWRHIGPVKLQFQTITKVIPWIHVGDAA